MVMYKVFTRLEEIHYLYIMLEEIMLYKDAILKYRY